ncbi:MAG TPA: hypothetical protein DCS93_29495 [Microscillaceae bacterium]|nr:hypothetical protein [Microscillaceae bacterium]
MKKIITLSLTLFTLYACVKTDDVIPVTITTEDFNTTIDENPSQNQALGTVKGSASQGSVSFEITSQNPANALAINASSGELTVATPSLFDFETRQKIEATVKVSANGQEKNAQVTINLIDINENTTTITTEDFSATIDENPSQNQVLGTVKGSASQGSVSFEITSQNPANALAINASSGELTVATPSLFDFETRQKIEATVKVSANGQEKNAQVTINLTDVNENTTTITTEDFSATIDENPSQNQVLGTVKGSASQGSVSFEITSQNPANALAINVSSGELTVATPSLFDFETRQKIEATVKVSANGQEKNAQVTINLTDVNENTRTIWRGANLVFTKATGADPTQAANQDRITDNVWITRGNSGGQIFNAKTESSANKNSSPADTEWAVGTVDNIDQLTFKPFRAAVGSPRSVVGKNLVLHLIKDDIYISVKFTSWSTSRAGGFSYERSTE